MFGSIVTDSVVQVGDKTRIDCSKSFAVKGEDPIEAVVVYAEAGADPINIFDAKQANWYLDWAYTTEGEKVITIEVENAVNTISLTKTITVLTEAEDRLFSTDSDLIAHEPDIAKWVPSGKSSHNYAHRKAQLCILDWLDALKIYKNDGTRLEKADLPLTDDLRQLSTYLTLSIIFASLSNSVGDIFENKQKTYESKAEAVKNRGRIQADFNGDGVVGKYESQDLKSMVMVRR